MALGKMALSFVVGYQTKTVEAGFTSISPMFIPVTGDKVITPADISGAIPEFDSLQIFDGDGNVEMELFYLEEGSMAPEGGKTGWYQDDMETPANNYAFPAGSEFWYNAADKVEITFSGAVNPTAVTKSLSAGIFTQIGNCTPVDLTPSALTFTGLQEFDSLQIFDGEGNVEMELFYLEEGSMAPEGGKTGWYQDDMETSADAYTLPAGKGFWANFQGEATVEIPSALK